MSTMIMHVYLISDDFDAFFEGFDTACLDDM